MNLQELKIQFRVLSGRYDIADDDASGMFVHLVNQACRWLDRLNENQKSWGVHYEQLAVDAFHVDFPYCRAVKEVWASDAEARWQLEKKDLQDLILEYLSTDTVTSGTPYYYAPVITRRIPEGADISALSTYLTYIDTQSGKSNVYNAIVIAPPAESICAIEVRGLFYSPRLEQDSDVNYWSEVHPYTLLKAMLRELEIFNQNATKVKLWDQVLQAEMIDIGKDLVEELVAEVTQIEN